MSIYTITHSCGHTQEHQIYGTNVRGERERKADYLADRTCSDCYQEQQAAERAAQSKQAKKDNADLPKLTGSEKQISWAETIRAKASAELKKIREFAASHSELSAEQQETIDAGLKIIDNTLANTDSRFWIDNRAVNFDGKWLGKQLNK